MTIKSDKWIKWQCSSDIPENRMIHPFSNKQIKEYYGEKHISHGVSSYGYDISLAPEMKLFKDIEGSITEPSIIDPKYFNKKDLVDLKIYDRDQSNDRFFILPPNAFALGRSVEYFKIPRNVLAICLGKSTYARCGLVVNSTPFEPEFEGTITLEFSNTTNLPMKIYANEGIAQVIFFESDEECETSYADRNGKYQGQTGITLPRS